LEDRFDLHVHTTFSDGDMTPAEVVETACELGLAGIAVADHDEVAGVREAAETGKSCGLSVIPAVEFSTYEGKADIHILGYLLDVENEKLLEHLTKFRDARLDRGIKMVERLRQMGVTIDVDSVLEIAGGGAVGRPHIAQALLKNGAVDNYEEAFRKYIGLRSPAYVQKYQLRPGEAFDIIKEAGGVGVLAHPGTLRRDDLIPGFVAAGMRGIEVYHPKHGVWAVDHYRQTAEKMGLVATGGSDSHGSKDGALLLGSCTVAASVVDELERAKSY
jgi:predicted metal-dependent phosphoesterase TrpH